MRSRASKVSTTDEKEATTEPTSPSASADPSKKSQKKVKQVFHYYFTRKSRRKSAGSPSQCSVVSGMSAVSAMTAATVPPLVTLEGYSKDLVIRNPSRKANVRATASSSASRPEAAIESLDFEKGLGDLVASSCEESATEHTKGSSECKAHAAIQHSRSRKQSTEQNTGAKGFPDSKHMPLTKKAASVIEEEDDAVMQVSKMVTSVQSTAADRGEGRGKFEPGKHPHQASSSASSSISSSSDSSSQSGSSSSTVHSGDNQPGRSGVGGDNVPPRSEALLPPSGKRHPAGIEVEHVESHHSTGSHGTKKEATCSASAFNSAPLALSPIKLLSPVSVMPPTPVDDVNRSTQAWEPFWTPQTSAQFSPQGTAVWQTAKDHFGGTHHGRESPHADATSNGATDLTSKAKKNLLSAFHGNESHQAKPMAPQLERISGIADEAHLSPTAAHYFPSHDPFNSSTPLDIFHKPLAAKEVPWAKSPVDAATRVHTEDPGIFGKFSHDQGFIESAREGLLEFSPHSLSGRRQPGTSTPLRTSTRSIKGELPLIEPIRSCIPTDLTSIKDSTDVLSASPFSDKLTLQKDGVKEEPSAAAQNSLDVNASGREKPPMVILKSSVENVVAKQEQSMSLRGPGERSAARVNSQTHGEGNGETLAGENRPASANDANAAMWTQPTTVKEFQPSATENAADELNAKSQNAHCFPVFPEQFQREQADQIQMRIRDADSKLRSKVTSALRPSLLQDTCSTALPIENFHGRPSGFARLRKRLDDGRPPSAQARQHVTVTKWKPKAYEEFRQTSEKQDGALVPAYALESNPETGTVPGKRDSSTQVGGNISEAGPSVSTQTLQESPPSSTEDSIRESQQSGLYRKEKSHPRQSQKRAIPPWLVLTGTAFLMAIAHYFGVKVGRGKLCN